MSAKSRDGHGGIALNEVSLSLNRGHQRRNRCNITASWNSSNRGQERELELVLEQELEQVLELEIGS